MFSSITGTANQIIASSASTGAVTLSTPQDIATASTVQFNKVKTTEIDTTSAVKAIDVTNRILYDSGGNSKCDWETAILRDVNGTAIDWTARTLRSAIGVLNLTWATDNLITLSTTTALRFTNKGVNTLTINPPAAFTTYALTLPTAQGAASTFLSNNGSGVLSWVAPTGSGTVNSGTANQVAYYATSTNAVSGSTVQINNSTGVLSAFGLSIFSNAGP